jgi:hypothetical protein
MNNSDFKKGFFVGLGIMGAVVVAGFATGLFKRIV